MKKRYSIKQHEAGFKVEDLCREMGISVGTLFNWRSKYTGLEVGNLITGLVLNPGKGQDECNQAMPSQRKY